MMRILASLGLCLAAVVLIGPYEPTYYTTRFDHTKLGDGVGVYLESTESEVEGIRPETGKQVIWAGLEEVPTETAIVYLHGFSASLHEIRPVPDKLAQALGANLVFTRFTGHGRDGDAMAEGSIAAWMQDAAEALAIGRTVGERVIILSTSTGGTIAAVAATEAELMKHVDGIVFVSPNFGINDPMASLLLWPAARYWLPLLAGARRSFEPQNAAQATHWTTEYPSRALFPMAAIVQLARKAQVEVVGIPALFYYSDDDRVVDPTATAEVMKAWGGPVTRVEPVLADGDDAFAHVIAGDILSPGNTETAVQVILNWIAESRG